MFVNYMFTYFRVFRGFERNFGTLILIRKWRVLACFSARRENVCQAHVCMMAKLTNIMLYRKNFKYLPNIGCSFGLGLNPISKCSRSDTIPIMVNLCCLSDLQYGRIWKWSSNHVLTLSAVGIILEMRSEITPVICYSTINLLSSKIRLILSSDNFIIW